MAARRKVGKYPSESRKCKYCGLVFVTKSTYNGSQQKFCKPAHRKAYFDEGKQPMDIILARHDKKQEKRLRQIIREEFAALMLERSTQLAAGTTFTL